MEDASVVALWREIDLKAFSILSSKQLWDTLKEFLLFGKLAQIRCKCDVSCIEFKMEKGSSLTKHMMKFDELAMNKSSTENVIDEQNILVELLGNQYEDYEHTRIM